MTLFSQNSYRIHCVFITFLLTCASLNAFAQEQNDDKPFQQITVKGDRFYAGDKPIVFWGFNAVRGMNLTDEQYAKISERLKFLGVNLMRTNTIDVRHWSDGNIGGGLLPKRGDKGFIKTTRRLVNVEPFFKLLNVYRDNGIYFAVSISMGRLLVPGDSSILVTTPADKAAWEAAITEMRSSKFKHVHVMLPQFDERALALRKEFAGQFLNLKNPRTGVALKDDPQLLALETVNEKGMNYFIRHAQYQKKMPKYFADKLQKKWNTFLKDKYKTQESLSAAWAMKDTRLGVLPEENLDEGTVTFAPVAEKDYAFSPRRRKDLLDFCVQMDMDHQTTMAAHYRKVGYKGISYLTDFWCWMDGTDGAWVRSDLAPVLEDHSYCRAHDVFRSPSLIAAGSKIAAPGPNPFNYHKPYIRTETRNADGSGGNVHFSRIANPLYYAVYSSLIGRDATCFHCWYMAKGNSYDFTMDQPTYRKEGNGISGTDCLRDIPWQMVFRAAGRLCRSREIPALHSSNPQLGRISSNADMKTSQIYRSAKEGVLTVQTDHFTAVAVDHPYRFSTPKLEINITSDKCNVVIVEQLSATEFEITAVGMAGKSVQSRKDPLVFKPITWVTGTVTFTNAKVKSVQRLSDKNEIQKTVTDGNNASVKLVKGTRLYRVKLK